MSHVVVRGGFRSDGKPPFAVALGAEQRVRLLVARSTVSSVHHDATEVVTEIGFDLNETAADFQDGLTRVEMSNI